tara:strand:- start:1834 stop:2337 length:504 start_codon:yes stop_codon:yes gene_type:complete
MKFDKRNIYIVSAIIVVGLALGLGLGLGLKKDDKKSSKKTIDDIHHLNGHTSKKKIHELQVPGYSLQHFLHPVIRTGYSCANNTTNPLGIHCSSDNFVAKDNMHDNITNCSIECTNSGDCEEFTYTESINKVNGKDKFCQLFRDIKLQTQDKQGNNIKNMVVYYKDD